jgi:hypothetical protein
MTMITSKEKRVRFTKVKDIKIEKRQRKSYLVEVPTEHVSERHLRR